MGEEGITVFNFYLCTIILSLLFIYWIQCISSWCVSTIVAATLFFILGDVSKAAPQGSGMCRGRRTADKQDGRLPDQNGSPAIGRQFEHNQIKKSPKNQEEIQDSREELKEIRKKSNKKIRQKSKKVEGVGQRTSRMEDCPTRMDHQQLGDNLKIIRWSEKTDCLPWTWRFSARLIGIRDICCVWVLLQRVRQVYCHNCGKYLGEEC